MNIFDRVDLVKSVLDEALAIRITATDVERERLDHEKVMGWNSRWSIYGQMTGDHMNERARELIESCGQPFSWDLHRYKPCLEKWDHMMDRHIRPVTALEFWICQDQNRFSIKSLVEYIQGKTNVVEI